MKAKEKCEQVVRPQVGVGTLLLGVAVPARRVEIAMAPGDAALILRITTRLPEGKLLCAAEIAAVPYELAWLERNA